MLITLFKQFLLPPGLQILLFAAAYLVRKPWRRFSCLLMVLAWSSLLLFSLPAISSLLFLWLEAPYVQIASPEQIQTAQVVLVLGGGRQRNNPEYEGDQVSHSALWRLRYGARLANQYSLPVLVSGGRVYDYEASSEAELGQSLLQQEFGVETVWLEPNSRNTWENAKKSAQLLIEKNISGPVLLVTHAYHMRRAEGAFRHAGVDVVPMPTGFISTDLGGWWNDWIPSAGALMDSRTALHEYLGLLFYRLRQ